MPVLRSQLRRKLPRRCARQFEASVAHHCDHFAMDPRSGIRPGRYGARPDWVSKGVEPVSSDRVLTSVRLKFLRQALNSRAHLG